MRRALLVAVLTLVAVPALAEDFPQSPKIGPPEPLPEPICDTTLANNGGWLLGRWVAPQTRMEFTRAGDALAWTMDRKGSVNTDFGWQDGTQIGGGVETVSGCTVTLSGGQGAFRFQGVLTDSGKLYGFAVNPKGETVRFTLRRER